MKAPLAHNLKAAREAANLTQEDLAIAAGIRLRSLQEWESGRALPRWPRLVKVADALGREPAWFYTEHAKEAA